MSITLCVTRVTSFHVRFFIVPLMSLNLMLSGAAKPDATTHLILLYNEYLLFTLIDAKFSHIISIDNADDP